LEQTIQSLTQGLSSIFSTEFIVFFISLLPILELRGGLIAASLLGLNWKIAFVICILGNLLPVPLILLFVKKIFSCLKNTRFVKLIRKLEDMAAKKSEKVLKYKKFGLFLFVAIPLPGTGAWTGALIASLIDMKIKDAFLWIALGVICAGLIVMGLSYGIFGF
jgi:uncharacterized membrane protein